MDNVLRRMQIISDQSPVNSPRKAPKRSVGASLKPKRTLSSKPPKKAVKGRTARKKKKTIVGLWREWLVPDGALRRYKGLRGIYWYWLSLAVRKDEWEKYGGLCLTCLLPIEHWTMGHCGHIVAAQHCGEYLRFARKNLTIQHPACNSDRITPDAAALNAVHYDERHGLGAWEALRSLKKQEAKNPTQGQYRELIRALPSYQEAVDKQNNSSEVA